MKDFWSENKGIIGKLILQQFGATFFGILMLLVAAASNKIWIQLAVSAFSTLMYLYLLYNFMWEKGGQDRIKVDSGRAVRSPLKGLYISLIANIPNFIIAALMLISYPLREHSWAASMYAIGRGAGFIWEAMYHAIIYIYSPYNPIAYLLVILPALFVCEGAYLIGFSNNKILSFLKKNRKDR